MFLFILLFVPLKKKSLKKKIYFAYFKKKRIKIFCGLPEVTQYSFEPNSHCPTCPRVLSSNFVNCHLPACSAVMQCSGSNLEQSRKQYSQCSRCSTVWGKLNLVYPSTWCHPPSVGFAAAAAGKCNQFHPSQSSTGFFFVCVFLFTNNRAINVILRSFLSFKKRLACAPN